MANQSSDIPEGFKITEIGPLPVEWHTVPFDHLMKPRSESIIPGDVPDMRYVGLEHMDSGETKIRRWGNAQQVRSAKSRFYPNDILYGKLRPYLDKAAVAEWEGMCSTDILVFSAYDDRAIPAYLAHSMHTKPFLDHAVATTSGVNHPRTSWGSISRFTTACPPLSEQKGIARVLSIIQKAIAAQDKVIAAARETKRSLMRHLFTYGPVPVADAEKVHLKETEIGPVPAHWEVRMISDVCEVKGSTISLPELIEKDTKDANHCMVHGIKVADMNLPGNERRFANANTRARLPESLAKRLSVPPDSIVFPKRGAAIATNKKRLTTTWTALDPNLIAVSPLGDVDCYYAFYWFLTVDISRLQSPGPTPQLNKKDIAPVLMPVPPQQEQQRVALILSSVDSKIEVETMRKASLQSLFQTMLHNLMTGKLRVKDLEVTAG